MLNLKVLILKIGKICKIRDLWYENRTARNRPISRRNYGKSVLVGISVNGSYWYAFHCFMICSALDLSTYQQVLYLISADSLQINSKQLANNFLYYLNK